MQTDEWTLDSDSRHCRQFKQQYFCSIDTCMTYHVISLMELWNINMLLEIHECFTI